MSIVVNKNEDFLVVTFKYSEKRVKRIRQVRGRRWDAENKVWRIPYSFNNIKRIKEIFIDEKVVLNFQYFSENQIIIEKFIEYLELKGYGKKTESVYLSHIKQIVNCIIKCTVDIKIDTYLYLLYNVNNHKNIRRVQNMYHNNNYNIDRSKGKHLGFEDRLIIAHLYNKQDKNFTEIAKEMNCHRTTISREIKKGVITLKDYDWTDKEVYVPEIVQEVYDNNATAKGANLKIGKNKELAEFIEEKIKNNYSPEAIAYYIEQSEEFEISIY